MCPKRGAVWDLQGGGASSADWGKIARPLIDNENLPDPPERPQGKGEKGGGKAGMNHWVIGEAAMGLFFFCSCCRRSVSRDFSGKW